MSEFFVYPEDMSDYEEDTINESGKKIGEVINNTKHIINVNNIKHVNNVKHTNNVKNIINVKHVKNK
tara:strand:- start:28 stop:228 length:201 start_codon:yes stop_codon:yes gene_type:complete